ncbi:hypothetical protein MENTO_v1c05670 [Mesoplasma entomophilum]|uniref:Uncharacterized protein n=1 Tax=Mesoplasma entomophilum TaxID=2149 RepID=A0A3S5Y0F3_9MOLU|nr:hypothetical protein [Mesoplasma entomophilum]ATQ35699.1 hypothetical protein CS528_02975 [Mesoplasma entomophilum]ATZ19669.1 hypothetical protein MENTO_v1c05670 [Mesoplasma entomophilum]
MKNFKKVILNMSVCVNVMIFGILALVAFYSIGFNDVTNLSNVSKITHNKQYFALALTGIILVWASMILPILKLFFRKPFQTMIISITTLVVLTMATAMMMAADITFVINNDSDTWKVFGVMLLLLVGFSITIQPQIKILFFKNEDKKSLEIIEEA